MNQFLWFELAHHSVDVLIVNGLFHKQAAGGDAVLPFVEKHGAHALWGSRHKQTS